MSFWDNALATISGAEDASLKEIAQKTVKPMTVVQPSGSMMDTASLLTRLGLSTPEVMVATAILGARADVTDPASLGMYYMIRACQISLKAKGYNVPTDGKAPKDSETDYALQIVCGRTWREQRWLQIAMRVYGALPYKSAVEIYNRANDRAGDGFVPKKSVMPLVLGVAGIGALIYFSRKG